MLSINAEEKDRWGKDGELVVNNKITLKDDMSIDDTNKTITFSVIANNLIVESLKKILSEKKLYPFHLGVYEKFILGK